jgi:hypothetical protein
MNGKPGDDPILDIVHYQRRVFSPAIDPLITEIVRFGGREALEKQFDLSKPPPLDRFEPELRALRDRLKQEARERGWEVE